MVTFRRDNFLHGNHDNSSKQPPTPPSLCPLDVSEQLSDRFCLDARNSAKCYAQAAVAVEVQSTSIWSVHTNTSPPERQPLELRWRRGEQGLSLV